MDSTIASLFDDDDLVEEVPRRFKTPLSEDNEPSPRPSKRRRQALRDDSDDEGGVIAPKDVSMRAMQDLDEPVGISWGGADAMEKQLAAELKHQAPPPTPYAIQSSSPPPEGADGGSKQKGKPGNEKKPRKKPLLLNEARLVGDNGFPKLIKDMKDFKPRGKGHEASDLNRILQVYQFWTHQLYPKAPFRDTVIRVEKLCRTRMLMSSVSRWKDDAKGVPHIPDLDSEDDSSDAGNDGEQARVPATESQTQLAAEGGAVSDAPSSLRTASRPPTSASAHDFGGDDLYDEDLEAFMQEPQPPSPPSSTPGPVDIDPLDDDSLWEQFEDPNLNASVQPSPLPPGRPSVANDNMDQGDWDAFDEMERLVPKPPQATTNITQAQPPPPEPFDDDMDDMYV